jgi:hypothetical protein
MVDVLNACEYHDLRAAHGCPYEVSIEQKVLPVPKKPTPAKTALRKLSLEQKRQHLEVLAAEQAEFVAQLRQGDVVAVRAAADDAECGLTQHYALCKRKQQRTFFLALLLETPGIAKNLVRLRPLLLDERAEDEAPQSQWRLPSGDERVDVSQDRFCRVRLPSPLFDWVGLAVHNASRSGTLSAAGLQQIVTFGNFADADLRRATTSAAQVRGGARAASSSTQAGAGT